MPEIKTRTLSRGMEAIGRAGNFEALEVGSPPSDAVLEGGEDYMVKTWYTGSTVFGIDQKGRKYVAKDGMWRKFRTRKPIVIPTKKLDVKKFLKAANLYKSAHTEITKAFTAGEIPDSKKLPWIDDDDYDDDDPQEQKLMPITAYIPVEREND